MRITTADSRKWIVKPRHVTLYFDDAGNITEAEHCALRHPDGYPEIGTDRPYKEPVSPERSAALIAALAWQPAQAVERLTRRDDVEITPIDEGTKR